MGDEDPGAYYHVQAEHVHVENDGYAKCILYSAADENGQIGDSENEDKVTHKIDGFGVGDVYEVTVHDWISYPDGRVRLDMLFEEGGKVGVNRYMGFAIRGDKDNGSARYTYFKTAKYNNKGKNLQRFNWDKDNNPFQQEFKLIFYKTTATETKVEIRDVNGGIYYENTFNDEFPEHLDKVLYIGMYFTGSTRARYTLKTYKANQ